MSAARFFDGLSAAERAVRVRPGEGGLHLDGEGFSEFWLAADVVVLEQRGQFRLGVKSAPDARLILERNPETEAILRQLEVLSVKKAAQRGAILVGALVGASAILLAIIFIGAPLAAGPLARSTPREVEAQMGENLAGQAQLFFRPCENAAADTAIAPLVARLEAAAAPGFAIELTFVRHPAPNAMALPGGRVMVTSALLETLEQPDELAAVLAHEFGHVHARDGMVSLYRNAGLGIVLEAVTGGSGVAQQVILLAGQLADLRYTRAQEERADEFALAAMARAGYDPEALARAFARLDAYVEEKREKGPDIDIDAPEWMFSHPDLGKRIVAARAAAAPARFAAFSPEQWNIVHAACE
jgi:beta-barrel assembly-enhancing protease